MTRTIWLLLLPAVAFAHTDGGGTGLMKGLMHPVMGLDHLLAMVSVGVVSSQMGASHVWRIPGVFVLSMLFGGLLGIFGLPVPMTETGIALSVLVLGISILSGGTGGSDSLVYGVVSLFGILHGYAHGAEIPRSIGPELYVLGFLFTTSSLHIFGVILGEMLRNSVPVLRTCGAIVAGTGCIFLLK